MTHETTLSAAMRARWANMTPEQRAAIGAKISAAHFGKKKSPAARAAMRRAWAKRRAELFGKACRVCGEAKPFTEFHKRPRSGDGYDYRCKACQSELDRRRYAAKKAAKSAPTVTNPPTPRGFLYTVKAMLGFASAP